MTLPLEERSNDIDVQNQAFLWIVTGFVWFPSKARSAFTSFFDGCKDIDISDTSGIALSWKRPGVEYSVNWLFWYRQALRCLETQPSPVIEAAARLEHSPHEQRHVAALTELLSRCK